MNKLFQVWHKPNNDLFSIKKALKYRLTKSIDLNNEINEHISYQLFYLNLKKRHIALIELVCILKLR